MALPLGLINVLDQQSLSVAVPEGSETELGTALRFACGLKIKPVAVKKDILEKAIFYAYRGDDEVLATKLDKLKEAEGRELTCSTSEESLLEFRPEKGEAGIFLASLIDYAISRSASDIHILPGLKGSTLKLRISGELLTHRQKICLPRMHERIIQRLKVLAGLDTTLKKMPQDAMI